MSQITHCPKCQKQVAAPSAAAETHVRCPLCHQEYTLREALEYAPPMLEIVHAGVGGMPEVEFEPEHALPPVMAAAAAHEQTIGFEPEHALPAAMAASHAHDDAIEFEPEHELPPVMAEHATHEHDFLAEHEHSPPMAESTEHEHDFMPEHDLAPAAADHEELVGNGDAGSENEFAPVDEDNWFAHSHAAHGDAGEPMATDPMNTDPTNTDPTNTEPLEGESEFEMAGAMDRPVSPLASDAMLQANRPSPAPVKKGRRARKEGGGGIIGKLIAVVLSAVVAVVIALPASWWITKKDVSGLVGQPWFPSFLSFAMPQEVKDLMHKPPKQGAGTQTANSGGNQTTGNQPTGNNPDAEPKPDPFAEPKKPEPTDVVGSPTPDKEGDAMPAKPSIDDIATNKTPPKELPDALADPKPPAADATPEPKPDPAPDLKSDPAPDLKPDTKPPFDPFTEPKPDPKPDAKPDTTPGPFDDPKPEPKPGTEPDTKPGPFDDPKTTPAASNPFGDAKEPTVDVKPEPKPATKPVGLKNPPAVSMSDALDAIKEATDAAKAFDAAVTDPTAKQAYYKKLFAAAEKATYAVPPPLEDPAAEGLRHLVTRAGDASEQLNPLGRVAAYWIASPKRDPHETGILLSAKIDSVEKQNGLTVAKVTLNGGLPDGKQPEFLKYTIVTKGDLPDAGGNVVLAGAIINQPALAIDGYAGQEPLVIWSNGALIVQK